MPDVDVSKLNRGLIAESWFVALEDYIIDLAWSPVAPKLAAVTVEGAVFLIDDLGDSAYFKQIGQHRGGANSLSWRRDGGEFATAGHDGLVKIWEGDSGQEICSIEAGGAWVAKTLYSPRRNVLATAAGKHLKLWNDKRIAFYSSSKHASTIADLAWNPIGPGIAAAAKNGVTLHLSDETAEPRKFHWKGSSLAVSWSPNAHYIVTGEQNATVHFVYVKSGEHAQIRGFSTKVFEVSWDASGRWLATGSGDTFLLCDCGHEGPAGRQPRPFQSHSNKLAQLAFQPDGELLASADADAFLFLWQPIKHDKVVGGVLLSSPASCVRWCDGDKLAVGQEDGRIVVFQIHTVSKGGK